MIIHHSIKGKITMRNITKTTAFSLLILSVLIFSTANAASIQLNFTNGWMAEFDDVIKPSGYYGIPNITNPDQELSGRVDWIDQHTRTHLGYAGGVNTLIMREHRYIANGTNNYLQLTAEIIGTELNLDEFLNLAANNSTTFIAEYSYTRNYAPNYDYTVESTTLSHVPLPAAVWFFGSGLLGLIGFTKRKKTALQ